MQLAEVAAQAARKSRKSQHTGARYRIGGRQRLVAAPSALHQQVVVQTHIWYNRAGRTGKPSVALEQIAARLTYIAREGAGRGGAGGKLFGSREPTPAAARQFAHDAARAPHVFRFIVSPERSDALDLENFARDLMAQLGADLGFEPDWIAAAHYDTELPHVHIELIGRDAAGDVIKIHEDYLFRGLRYRAQELATRALGLRTEGELCQSLGRAARSPRLTQLDRRLLEIAGVNIRDKDRLTVRLLDLRRHARVQRMVSAPAMEHYLRARLDHLCELGLAQQVTSTRCDLAGDLADRLRALGRRGDIVKQLQIADAERVKAAGELVLWERGKMIGRWIEGRVISRHFVDELSDKELLVIEATDGRSYVVGLNATSDQLGKTLEGDLVRVSGGKKGYPNVYLQARVSLEQQVTAEGRTWLDGKLLAEARQPETSRSKTRRGFAGDVADALEARRRVLIDRGLVKVVSGTDRFVAGFLDKLYRAELAAFDREHGHRYGPRRAFVAEVEARGELQVVQLESGPHALLIERAGYRLTPLRPQMVPHVGKQVGLTLSPAAVDRPLDRGARVRVRVPGRERGKDQGRSR